MITKMFITRRESLKPVLVNYNLTRSLLVYEYIVLENQSISNSFRLFNQFHISPVDGARELFKPTERLSKSLSLQ